MKWLIRTCALALVILLTAENSTALAAEHAKRTFADTVGLNVKFIQGEPQAHIQLLKELGVRWVRDTVDWPTVESFPGVYKPFPPAFVERLEFYKKNNIGVIFGLWYDNPTAYPNSAANPHHSVDAEAYGNYAAIVAKQLQTSGVRFVIEIYNEPHNFLKNLGGTWNGKPPAAWLDQYVKMVTAAVARVKAIDPGIRLLAGDDMWIIHYWFFEKGLPAALDGLTIHPYIKAWPEMCAAQQETDWTRPFEVVDADRSLKSAVRRLRNQGAEKLGHTPAIWITEWGWPIDGDMADTQPLNEDGQAALLPRAYITAADAGIEVLAWFSSQDSVDGSIGLMKNDGTPRKSYWAMKTMVEQLGSATEIEHLTGADHPTSGLQVYRFHAGDVCKLVVWDIGGNSSALLVDDGHQDIQAKTVLGQSIMLTHAPGGAFNLAVSRSPIYISGVSATATIKTEPPQGQAPVFLFP